MENSFLVEGSPIWNEYYQTNVKYFSKEKTLAGDELLPAHKGSIAKKETIITTSQAISLLDGYIQLLETGQISTVSLYRQLPNGTSQDNLEILNVRGFMQIRQSNLRNFIYKSFPAHVEDVLPTFGPLDNNAVIVAFFHDVFPNGLKVHIVYNDTGVDRAAWMRAAATYTARPSAAATSELGLLQDRQTTRMDMWGGNVASFLMRKDATDDPIVPALINIRDRARAAAATSSSGAGSAGGRLKKLKPTRRRRSTKRRSSSTRRSRKSPKHRIRTPSTAAQK